MKIGDSVNLIKETGDIVPGIITEIHPDSLLTIRITNPNGTTQEYRKISCLPDNKKMQKPRYPYWSEIPEVKNTVEIIQSSGTDSATKTLNAGTNEEKSKSITEKIKDKITN